MSADRKKSGEETESFSPDELILIIQRFNNLPNRNKVYLVEAAEAACQEIVSDFQADLERILTR